MEPTPANPTNAGRRPPGRAWTRSARAATLLAALLCACGGGGDGTTFDTFTITKAP